MKNLIFGLIATFTLSISSFAQIDHNEKINNNFSSIVVDNMIGEKHNQALEQLFKENPNILSNNLTEKNKIILNFIKKEYSYDVSKNINFFNKYINNGRYELFTPELFISDNKTQISDYFYTQISKVLTDTKSMNENDISSYIDSKLLNINMDNNYYKYEKETFINMLHIFKSSIMYFSNNNSAYYSLQTSSNTSSRIGRNNYWKIAAADFVEGIAGGCVGAHVGFLIGAISGSAVMAIGLW